MRILETSSLENPEIGEFEVDESDFGSHHVRGKRGRGAGDKTIAFGLFKRDVHLKETEFRFNHRGENLYQILLKMLRENPLK